MEWDLIEKMYLALSRIFDGFVKFFLGKFGDEE